MDKYLVLQTIQKAIKNIGSNKEFPVSIQTQLNLTKIVLKSSLYSYSIEYDSDKNETSLKNSYGSNIMDFLESSQLSIKGLNHLARDLEPMLKKLNLDKAAWFSGFVSCFPQPLLYDDIVRKIYSVIHKVNLGNDFTFGFNPVGDNTVVSFQVKDWTLCFSSSNVTFRKMDDEGDDAVLLLLESAYGEDTLYVPVGLSHNYEATDKLKHELILNNIKESNFRILVDEIMALCQEIDYRGCLVNLMHDYCVVLKDSKEMIKKNFHNKDFSEKL